MRLSPAPWALLLLCSLGCRTPDGDRMRKSFQASVRSQEVTLVDQGFRDVTVREVIEVQAPPGARVTHARVGLYLDKQTLVEMDDPLEERCGEGGIATVVLTRKGRYASSLEEMEALEKRQTLKLVVRGTLTLNYEGETRTVDLLRAKEVRAPRMLVPKMKDVGAARYDNGEVTLQFHLALFNPNPFPVRLRHVHATLHVAGDVVGESTVGQADVLAPSSTASYELEQFLDESSETLNKRLFRMSSIPYAVAGELTAEEYARPFELQGTLHLEHGR